MLISLSGMVSQLDTIAASEADQSRASDLHQTATSLQIAAWALSTLQQSVHGFYGAVSARQIMRCNAQIMPQHASLCWLAVVKIVPISVISYITLLVYWFAYTWECRGNHAKYFSVWHLWSGEKLHGGDSWFPEPSHHRLCSHRDHAGQSGESLGLK